MFGQQNYQSNDNTQNQDQDAIDRSIDELNSSMGPSDNMSAPPQTSDNSQTYTNGPSDSGLNTSDDSSNQIVDLVDLKTKALDELYPIIHKLDLSAEENFKTLMMMIQATDNKDLIAQAYDAAEKIEDESTRARALLDVVNEINYFTNHPSLEQ